MPSESDCAAFITSVFNFERQAQAARAQMAAVIQVRRVVGEKCRNAQRMRLSLH